MSEEKREPEVPEVPVEKKTVGRPPKAETPLRDIAVVATEKGFHGNEVKNIGVRFSVKEGETASWFKPV